MATTAYENLCETCAKHFKTKQTTKRHCISCKNRLAAVKRNGHISETHPQLFDEIVFQGNKSNGVPREQIHPKLTQDIAWYCTYCENIYETFPAARTAIKRGCGRQECVNAIISLKRRNRARENRLMKYKTDQTYRDIFDSLDLKINGFATIHEALSSLQKIYIWTCAKGHHYEAALNNVQKGQGCPYCSGRLWLPDTSLSAMAPEYLLEWDWKKNDVTPAEVKYDSSSYKAWWKCAQGHSWQTLVYVRALGSGCPSCWSGASKGENEVREFLQNAFPKLTFESTRVIIPPKELDIYCPEKQCAIEFNGSYWHSNEFLKAHNIPGSIRERHQLKVDICRDQGISLAFVWDFDWNESRNEVKRDILQFINTGEITPFLIKLEK